MRYQELAVVTPEPSTASIEFEIVMLAERHTMFVCQRAPRMHADCRNSV